IPGLAPDDFKVAIDGKAARVETATWIGGRDTTIGAAPQESLSVSNADASAGAGRLIVFLFQKDLEPSRIVGSMRMLLKSRDFLGTLAPNDRVAVLSFDSNLKIWTDFTNDRERLDAVFGHDLLLARPPASQPVSMPSLAERISSPALRCNVWQAPSPDITCSTSRRRRAIAPRMASRCSSRAAKARCWRAAPIRSAIDEGVTGTLTFAPVGFEYALQPPRDP